MKIKAEIKDSQFLYEYKIGVSKESGSVGLSTKALVVFCKLVELCSYCLERDSKDRLNKLTDEIGAKAWIETHQSDAQDYINKHAQAANSKGLR